MISKFIRMFAGSKSNPMIDGNLSYGEKFNLALDLSTNYGFSVDSEVADFEPSRLNELVHELVGRIPEFLNKYPSMGFEDVITRFGGDCGTVHVSILQFINQYYPELPANITLGEINHGSMTYFNFDREKCEYWMKNGSPEIFDCHAWITIGKDVILDVTIGTYVNTRIDSDRNNNIDQKVFGGVIYGSHGSYQYVPITGLNSKVPVDLNTLKYSPVVIGSDSIQRLAPRQP